MHENRNEQNTGTKTIKKIGKATYKVVVHFNENATETMQDKLKRIMLREMEQAKDKKSWIVKWSTTKRHNYLIYLSRLKQSIGVIVMSKENSTTKSSYNHLSAIERGKIEVLHK